MTACEMLEGVTAAQSQLADRRKTITTEDIVQAAASGDKLAAKIMEKYHKHVAVGLVALCHTLDPDCFVITGGMSKFIDYRLLREMVADRTLPRISERLEICPSILGETGGMIGAAELVLAVAHEEQRLQTGSGS